MGQVTRLMGAASVALILAGCGATEPQIPEALLIPAACPAVPPPGASDNRIGRFVLELDACAQSRGGQIEAIAEIVGG